DRSRCRSLPCQMRVCIGPLCYPENERRTLTSFLPDTRHRAPSVPPQAQLLLSSTSDTPKGKSMQPQNSRTEASSTKDSSTLLSNIKSEQLNWLWEKRIPRGKLTMLDGDPGLGKSLLTLDLAARITTGKPMPDGTRGIRGTILLIAPEDGAADTIKPRIEAAGGDPSQVHLLNFVKDSNRHTAEAIPTPFNLSEHFLTLVKTIYHTPPT